MAIQANLNKKDKMTIAIVLFVGLIFMLGWFLIRPTISSIISLNEKIEEAELKQDEYKKKLINLTSGEALYGRSVSDINESTSDLYPIMNSSEIDRMVTSYVLKSGLFAENLAISMPSGPVDEKAYVYSDIANSSTSSSNKDTDSDIDTSGSDSLLVPYNKARESATTTQSSGIQRVGITLVVTGTRETCQAFIDDICTKSAVRITGFAWETMKAAEIYNEEKGTYELVDSGKVRLTISINLYMAEIADYEIAE